MGLLDFFQKGEEKPAQKAAPIAPPKAAKPASTERTYVIKSGDSLSKIAKQYYGNANDWNKIFQANKDVIKNPDLIHPGQKIIIP